MFVTTIVVTSLLPIGLTADTCDPITQASRKVSTSRMGWSRVRNSVQVVAMPSASRPPAARSHADTRGNPWACPRPTIRPPTMLPTTNPRSASELLTNGIVFTPAIAKPMKRMFPVMLPVKT